MNLAGALRSSYLPSTSQGCLYRDTSQSANISVNGSRNSRQKPDWTGGSGRQVMRDLTRRHSPTNHLMTERLVDCGSSSAHSSDTSIAMTVGVSTDPRGSTFNVKLSSSPSGSIGGFVCDNQICWRRGTKIEFAGLIPTIFRAKWSRNLARVNSSSCILLLTFHYRQASGVASSVVDNKPKPPMYERVKERKYPEIVRWNAGGHTSVDLITDYVSHRSRGPPRKCG